MTRMLDDRGFSPVQRGPRSQKPLLQLIAFITVGLLFTASSLVFCTTDAGAYHITYTVKSGDTLSRIVARQDTPGGWERLAGRNRLPDPDYIKVGQELILPDHTHHPRTGEKLRTYPDYDRAEPRRPARYSRSAEASRPTGIALRVGRCESGMRNIRNQSGSSASGYWQFLDSTWQSVTGKSGSAMYYSYAEQEAAFYELWDDGNGAGHWSASRHCWG